MRRSRHREARELGASMVLNKPINGSQFQSALQQVCGQSWPAIAGSLGCHGLCGPGYADVSPWLPDKLRVACHLHQFGPAARTSWATSATALRAGSRLANRGGAPAGAPPAFLGFGTREEERCNSWNDQSDARASGQVRAWIEQVEADLLSAMPGAGRGAMQVKIPHCKTAIQCAIHMSSCVQHTRRGPCTYNTST